MTIQQFEQRLSDLERQVAELQRESKPLRPFASVKDTFGMFANDPEFDEIVRLGREYREQANSEDEGC
jgi:phosphopantetheine adenylyltransferase